MNKDNSIFKKIQLFLRRFSPLPAPPGLEVRGPDVRRVGALVVGPVRALVAEILGRLTRMVFIGLEMLGSHYCDDVLYNMSRQYTLHQCSIID